MMTGILIYFVGFAIILIANLLFRGEPIKEITIGDLVGVFLSAALSWLLVPVVVVYFTYSWMKDCSWFNKQPFV